MCSLSLSPSTSIQYLSSSQVETNLIDRGYQEDVTLRDTDRSDLSTHVYEGGFKVWECSIDLCKYLSNQSIEIFTGKRVLELGCGAALPSILCGIRGSTHITAQDFNECVVNCFTKDNFQLNGIPMDNLSVVSGTWTQLIERVTPNSFDFILTAETIYNEDDYESLHAAIHHCLSESGIVLLAAKFFYFGVGGNIPGFLEYVKKQGKFTSREVFSTEDGVPRKIIELKRI